MDSGATIADIRNKNLELDKQNQTSDWGLENLSESQLKYAASDVLYLHQIKKESICFILTYGYSIIHISSIFSIYWHYLLV
mgnify:CR=1 FL=1